jgi:hypothetical protein
VTSLPILPNNLLALDCSNNPIEILPPLPIKLQTLICSNTSLKLLPQLSPSLQKLDISHTFCKELPDILPKSLTYLSISNTDIGYIHEIPEKLEELYCSFTKLFFIPKLPETLEILACSNTPLEKFPCLPSGIKEIYCWKVPVPFFSFTCGRPYRLKVVACEGCSFSSPSHFPVLFEFPSLLDLCLDIIHRNKITGDVNCDIEEKLKNMKSCPQCFKSVRQLYGNIVRRRVGDNVISYQYLLCNKCSYVLSLQ